MYLGNYVMIHHYLCTFLGDALSKAELQKAELELEINKAKTEEATLKDALLKMQAMNEGLGQDKVELNKIIMQVGHTAPQHFYCLYGLSYPLKYVPLSSNPFP